MYAVDRLTTIIVQAWLHHIQILSDVLEDEIYLSAQSMDSWRIGSCKSQRATSSDQS